MGPYQLMEYFRQLNVFEQVYTVSTCFVVTIISLIPWALMAIGGFVVFFLVAIGIDWSKKG